MGHQLEGMQIFSLGHISSCFRLLVQNHVYLCINFLNILSLIKISVQGGVPVSTPISPFVSNCRFQFESHTAASTINNKCFEFEQMITKKLL